MSVEFTGKQACIAPEGVFIIGTYDENGVPNAMNAAWGGVTEEAQLTICVDAEHKTAQNVLAPNSYMYDTIRVENWRDDIAPKDLTGAVFTLEGYLIDCSNEMEDVQFFDFTGNREEVRQSLPFHGKTFTVAFPENA